MVALGIGLAVLAFAATLYGARVVIRHAARLGLMAEVTARSSHAVPTPTGGGLAIAVAGTIAALPFVVTAPGLGIPALLAGLGMVALGYVDDRQALAAPYKLGAQLLLAAIAIGPVPLTAAAQGLGIEAPDMVLFIGALLYVTLWINLFNFMDGIDGLAGAEAAFMLLAAAGLVVFGHPDMAGAPLVWWMVGVGAAAAAFLIVNRAPARLFMGDSGSLYLGLMIAVFALATTALGWLSLAQWLILGALSVADSLATLIHRAVRGERVWQAHRQHAYQRLARRFGHGRVSLGYVAVDVVLLLPLAALAGQMPGIAAWLAAATLLGLGVTALALGAGRSGEEGDEIGAEPDDRQ